MEQELIQALKDTISAKNELITNLRAEIDRLKSSLSAPAAPQFNFPPLGHPNACPPQQPLIPVIGVPAINTPWYGPTDKPDITSSINSGDYISGSQDEQI